MFWKLGEIKAKRERILALDLLRGTFLTIIMTTHIFWAPSLYTFVGGGGALPASAAEGFFAISGILVGYLYGGRILKEPRKVTLKIWKRAAVLYGLTIFFTFLYTAWALLEPTSAMYPVAYNYDSPLRFVYETLTLQHAFGFADFLARYAVFMVFAPLAVWLIAKGKAWIVLLASFVIWALLHNTSSFPFLAAWQIIFMYGIVIGHYLPHIEGWFRRSPKRTQRSVFITICFVAFVTYAVSVLIFVLGPVKSLGLDSLLAIKQQFDPVFDKDHLSLARITIGVLWFTALYLIFRRYENQISRYSRGALEVMGRQSLFVYCFQSVVLFVVAVYFYPPVDASPLQNTIVTTVALAIVYAAAYYRKDLTEFGRKILSNKSTTQIP